MTTQDYRKQLEQARQALAQAVRKRDDWQLEILRLQQIVNALAVSADSAEIQERANAEWQVYIELAQAIEALVNNSTSPLTPIQVRDHLLFYGYNIGRYSNPMAMIHQTLKRLATDGRIRMLRGGVFTRTEMYESLLNPR
jgi:hypothetical protein